MEDLQTDTLADYGTKKAAENTDLDSSKDNENDCTAALLNGCDEIDDHLDLMDNCENASIGSNSDIWKGSDSEEEHFDKEVAPEKPTAEPESVEEIEEEKQAASEATEVTDEQETAGANQKTDDAGQSTDKEVSRDAEGEESQSDTRKETPSAEEAEAEKETSAVEDEDVGKEAAPAEDKDKETEVEKESFPDEDKDKDSEKEAAPAEDVAKETEAEKETPPAEDKEALPAEDKDKETAETTEITTKQAETEVEVVQEKDPLALDFVEEDTSASTSGDPLADKTSDTRHPDRNNDQGDEDCPMDYDYDDDFDPSLLCPEVSMAVDENPVITTNNAVPDDGTSSPLPYEPVFSTYVDGVTGAEICFNLTAEELELRKRLYGPTNPIQYTKIHCTACNVHLGSALDGQNNRFVHPLLKVLICKECYHFYTSGEFDKDEDGSELYCRWCGQGGQVICCSKCEYVFCKRCIRTNFGRKKMFEIRDSDNWCCFRCQPSQLITQRIACFEFFEYVKMEQARGSTSLDSDFWSKDHTRCCSYKKGSANGEEVKKRRRVKGEVDPDYNPLLNNIQNKPLNLASTSAAASNNRTITLPGGGGKVTLPRPISLVPKGPNRNKDNDIEFVRAIPAPQVALTSASTNKPIATKLSTFRTILPAGVNIRPVIQSPAVVKINSNALPPPLASTSSRLVANPLHTRYVNSNMMKHEWFEKTVRAAARVNSHLSYTLTQLNKAQSQAASVEELAVVHNKLQEILSSSINSLIQIRKNLRTEFIAGIKTVRLPSKKPESFANDDDVIFVSAPVATSTPAPTKKADPIIIIDKSTPSTSTAPATSKLQEALDKPKIYLKVKSVSELQNVPSDCITIPDDTPPPQLEEEKKEESPAPKTDDVVCNGDSKESEEKAPDVVEKTPEVEDKMAETESPDEPPIKRIRLDPSETAKETRTRKSKDKSNKIVYKVKGASAEDIKRMLSVQVRVTKTNLEELQKRLLMNGCH